jgi:hypothetical protein
MRECRSVKVRKIIALRARAAKLNADYEGALTACELAELRRAWSGV